MPPSKKLPTPGTSEGDNESNQARYDVTAEDGGTIGIAGDHAHIEHMSVATMTSRREVTWPVVVGSPPPVASAFQDRDAGRAVCGRGGDGGVGAGVVRVRWGGEVPDRGPDVHREPGAASGVGGRGVAHRGTHRVRRRRGSAGPGRPRRPVEDAAQALLGFLAATKRTWLVVLDDLAGPADLTELWPSTRDADNDDAGGGGSAGDGGEARVVVTTRRRDAALSGGGRRVIDVDVYTPEEAVRYLHDRLTPHAGPARRGVWRRLPGWPRSGVTCRWGWRRPPR